MHCFSLDIDHYITEDRPPPFTSLHIWQHPVRYGRTIWNIYEEETNLPVERAKYMHKSSDSFKNLELITFFFFLPLINADLTFVK